MSESPQTRSPRSWRRLSGASLAIAMGTGSIAAIAATPASQAESSASLVVSPSHKPVIAQTSCDSDAGPRAKTQTVLRNRGDRPGVTVTYSVAGAKPRSPWDFRVSVTSSGDSGFGVGQDGTIRADRQGHWSLKLTVANEGRYRAKSRLATLSGNQHCLRITAAP